MVYIYTYPYTTRDCSLVIKSTDTQIQSEEIMLDFIYHVHALLSARQFQDLVVTVLLLFSQP